MGLQVNGKTLDTDEEGYLANLSDWEPEVAQVMAEADECDLTDNHWEVINFLRSYYEEYQIAPAVRVLTKAIGKKLGKDKGNSRYLYQLYPYGPAKQACRYAGLPKPTGCVWAIFPPSRGRWPHARNARIPALGVVLRRTDAGQLRFRHCIAGRRRGVRGGIEIAQEIPGGRPSGSFRQKYLRRLDGADLLRDSGSNPLIERHAIVLRQPSCSLLQGDRQVQPVLVPGSRAHCSSLLTIRCRS